MYICICIHNQPYLVGLTTVISSQSNHQSPTSPPPPLSQTDEAGVDHQLCPDSVPLELHTASIEPTTSNETTGLLQISPVAFPTRTASNAIDLPRREAGPEIKRHPTRHGPTTAKTITAAAMFACSSCMLRRDDELRHRVLNVWGGQMGAHIATLRELARDHTR